MRAFCVFVMLLLCVTLEVFGLNFPSDERRDVPVTSFQPCRAKGGTEGRCVSLMSRSCLLYSSTAHLLLRKPNLCSLSFRDATVCCPLAALREADGGTQRPSVTRRTTQTPFTPARTTRTPVRPVRTTQAPFRPIRTTQTPSRPIRTTQTPLRPIRTTARSTPRPVVTRVPPRRVTSPASPLHPPTPSPTPEPPPTPVPGPVSSTRDLQSPIGLRPRPSLAPIVQSTTSSTPRRGFLQPGCGVNRPIAAFRAGRDYFQRPPPFARSERVLLGVHPWMALVGVREPGVEAGGRWICSGALLTPQIVLTSAQCVTTAARERLLVGVGEHDLTSRSDGVAGTHTVRDVQWHPAWSQPERRHALALLLLDRPTDHSPMIRPVCLPPPDPAPGLAPLPPLPDSRVVEVAYDLDSTGLNSGSARSRLAATAAGVAPLSSCVAALAGAPLTEVLFPGGPRPQTELCLAPAARCALDVGAPAVALAEDGTVVLEGLQLLDACAGGQPRLLLRVRHYVPFIAETIEKMMQPLSSRVV